MSTTALVREGRELGQVGDLNSSDICELRRLMISRCRLRGLSRWEIHQWLIDNGIINEETGQPFPMTTIVDDEAELRKRWRQQTDINIDERKKVLLAEIHEVKRLAFLRNDLNVVLIAIKQERDILGIDVAPTINVNLEAGQSLAQKLEGVAARLSLAEELDEEHKPITPDEIILDAEFEEVALS